MCHSNIFSQFISNFLSSLVVFCQLYVKLLSVIGAVDQSVKFAEKSKRGNLVPLSQCIFSDHLTPVLAYRCLVNENDHESPSFLFDSVESGFDAATTIVSACFCFVVLRVV